MYFNFALNLYMTLSSANNPSKQFGPRSGPTFCADLIGVKLFDALEVNLLLMYDSNIEQIGLFILSIWNYWINEQRKIPLF